MDTIVKISEALANKGLTIEGFANINKGKKFFNAHLYLDYNPTTDEWKVIELKFAQRVWRKLTGCFKKTTHLKQIWKKIGGYEKRSVSKLDVAYKLNDLWRQHSDAIRMNALETQVEDADKRLEIAAEKLNKKKEKIRDLRAGLQNAENAVEDLHQEVVRLGGRIAELEQTDRERLGQLEAERALVDTLNHKVEQREGELGATYRITQMRINQMDDKIRAKDKELSVLADANLQKEEAIEQLNEELKTKEEALKALKEESIRLQAELEEAKKLAKIAKVGSDALEKIAEPAEAQESLEAENESLKAEEAARREAIRQLASRMEDEAKKKADAASSKPPLALALADIVKVRDALKEPGVVEKPAEKPTPAQLQLEALRPIPEVKVANVSPLPGINSNMIAFVQNNNSEDLSNSITASQKMDWGSVTISPVILDEIKKEKAWIESQKKAEAEKHGLYIFDENKPAPQETNPITLPENLESFDLKAALSSHKTANMSESAQIEEEELEAVKKEKESSKNTKPGKLDSGFLSKINNFFFGGNEKDSSTESAEGSSSEDE